MYYTKQQRIKIYEAAADYFADDPVFGFCSTFSRYAIPEATYGPIVWNAFNAINFPEIFKHMPARQVYGGRWFPYDENGFALRLAILLIEIDKLKAE